MVDLPREPTPAEEGPAEPHVWPRYAMSSSINVAFLDPGLTSAHVEAFDDAWDVLVVRDEWRAWVREHLIPPSPFLVLLIRPGVDKRRLRKTKTGVSMNLPAWEVHEADGSGELISLYLEVIHSIYTKWAQVSLCPPPPPLSTSESLHGQRT